MAQEDRRRVLDMLAEGKISAEEAERLLEVLDGRESGSASSEGTFDDRIEQAVSTAARTAVSTARSVITAAASATSEQMDVDLRDAAASSDSESRVDSFQVEGIPTLVVENFNGRVEVVGDSSDDRVSVTAAIRHPDLVDYSVSQEGDAILVRSKPSGKRSFLGWRFLNRGAHIRISSPRKANVDVQSSNGRVVLRRIEGAGTLRTSNGRIEADGVSGKFDMRTSNSRIEVARVDGDFRLETSNGRITARDGRGTFDAETSNGSIRFGGEIVPRGESRLTTSNGSIVVALKGEPSLRVSARTSNGSVTCDREMEIRGERKKRELNGVIGDGEGALALRMSNGSIVIG